VNEPQEWKDADADGVRVRYLDVGAVATLRGRRLRRGAVSRHEVMGLWPAEWRTLLRDWLHNGTDRRKWTTLLKVAGHARSALAHQVLDGLVGAGLVEVEERRDKGTWNPMWVSFLDSNDVRVRVGLPDRDADVVQWNTLAAKSVSDARLHTARDLLDDLGTARAVRLVRLLLALDEWGATQRFGTRRDFAYAATGDTKGVGRGDFDWLGEHVDLEAFQIHDHTPALWLRAPLVLRGPELGILDLRGIKDCIGLTPSTIGQIREVEGRVGAWRVVENRTSFEHAARRHGHDDAVVWIPGFPPTWWLDTMSQLVAVAPVAAKIACDPDPAGVHIALQIAAVWTALDLAWEPWAMDGETLARLRHRKKLSDADRKLLSSVPLNDLPTALRTLVDWISHNQEKGEQEGVSVL